jgi:hypothetical protein
MFEDIRVHRLQLSPQAKVDHRRFGIHPHGCDAVFRKRREQFAAAAEEFERNVAVAQQLAEEQQAAADEGSSIKVGFFVSRAVKSRVGGVPLFTRSFPNVESSFMGIQVFGHELKHADDRIVEGLLDAKVHPDDAPDQVGNA